MLLIVVGAVYWASFLPWDFDPPYPPLIRGGLDLR